MVGTVHVADGQSLAALLASKRHFLNLTDARWEGDTEGDALPHVSVRLSQVNWIEPLDTEFRLLSGVVPPDDNREVELHVDGGVRLRVSMSVAREMRMSDYLDANPAFLPLWAVRVEGQDRVVDRVALNHEAIYVIRELEETDPRRRP